MRSSKVGFPRSKEFSVLIYTAGVEPAVLVVIRTVGLEFLIWAETLDGWVTSGKPFAFPVGLLTPVDKSGFSIFQSLTGSRWYI